MDIKNIAMNTLLLCIVLFFSCSQPNANKSEIVNSSFQNYYGEWKVYKFYSPDWIIAAEENYMPPETAETFINKTVLLQKNEASIFNKTCNNVAFDEHKENAYQYIYFNYRMVADTITGNRTRGLHPKQLGIISDSIEVVEISCDESYYELFVLSSEEIIIEHKSTFFFLKRVSATEKANIVKEFSGTGSKVEELPITGAATVLNLSYEFYKEADQLTITDKTGKELFSTDMTATNGRKTAEIPLRGVTKLVFKVTSSEASSKWKIKAQIK